MKNKLKVNTEHIVDWDNFVSYVEKVLELENTLADVENDLDVIVKEQGITLCSEGCITLIPMKLICEKILVELKNNFDMRKDQEENLDKCIEFLSTHKAKWVAL